jgi:hypothetical protein
MTEITEVIVLKMSDLNDYNIQVYIKGYEGGEIMILKIDQNYYYPELSSDKIYYEYQIKDKAPFINPDANIPLRMILYDYNHETVIDVRQGFVTLSGVSDFEIIPLLTGTENNSSVWRNGALVKSIEGPFQDDKLVNEIDLTKKAYYLATTNSPSVSEAQLLSIKWEYQYNQGEYAKFKNSKRSVVTDGGIKKCKIECAFHNREDIMEVSMFAFFNERSQTILSKSETTNKKPTGGFLIWSAKVTPEFETKVIHICSDLFGEEKKIQMANALMAVMATETARTFKAYIISGQTEKTLIPPEKIKKDDFLLLTKDEKGNVKKSSKAVGLIQFTQNALESMDEFKAGSGFDKLHEVKLNYAKMGEISQLDKVKKYLEPSKDKIKTPEDIYLLIFAPIGVGKPNSYILYESPSVEYIQNKSLDDKEKGGNGNEKIERWELLKRYYKLYEEGKKLIRNNQNTGIENIQNEDIENPDSNVSSLWHDPVESPRLNKYNYNGIVKPASATYGYARRYPDGSKKYHSGIDLFAIPGKDKVFACLDGTLQSVKFSNSAGWIIRIKIDNVKELLDQEKKVKYKVSYQDELKGIDITEKDKNVYLIYMHLQKVFFTQEDAKSKIEIKAGTALGYAGVSGSIASGTRAPHLHLEITTILDAYGTGEKNRTNPARFVKLNSYDTPDQDEQSKKSHYHKA